MVGDRRRRGNAEKEENKERRTKRGLRGGEDGVRRKRKGGNEETGVNRRDQVKIEISLQTVGYKSDG